MPTTKTSFTDRFILSLKAAESARIYWDSNTPGLAIRVSPMGKKTWYCVRRIAGQPNPKWVSLGTYPLIPLGTARDKARQVLAQMTEGKDPHQIQKAEKAAIRQQEIAKQSEIEKSKTNTFAAIAEQYLVFYDDKRLRNGDRVRAIIQNEFIPVWGKLDITEISKILIRDTVRAIRNRAKELPPGKAQRKSGGPHAARSAWVVIQGLFKFCVREDILTDNPTLGLEGRYLHGLNDEDITRDRVFDSTELKALWDGASQTPYPMGPLVLLLILTGQRLREIAHAKWSEVDLESGVLTVPKERIKSKTKAHRVPLTNEAVKIIDALPRFGPYLFSTNGKTPFEGFSWATDKLRVLVNQICGRELTNRRLHDCRRSCRTLCAEAGINPMIGELVLGHSIKQGVWGIYDRHDYFSERKQAMETYEAWLMDIVDPPPFASGPNVVPLRRQG